MAQYAHPDREEEFPQSYVIQKDRCVSDDFPQSYAVSKDRCISNASTALPSSPPLTRAVSPEHDREFAELEECDGFELSGFPDEISEVSSTFMQPTKFEQAIKEKQGGCASYPVGSLADEVSKSYELLRKVSETAEISKVLVEQCKLEGQQRKGQKDGTALMYLVVSFGLGLLTRYLSGISIASACCAIMGVLAVLMILPGIYLYIVDGCRPEDYEEDTRNKGYGQPVFWLVILCLGSVYSICVSSIFRILMVAVALLLVLPGMYLYIIDGCRPEDYEVNHSKKSGTHVVWLVIACLGSVYGMCISGIMRVVMGTVALLMILPGIYLYMVDGCRPEDYEENDRNESSAPVFWPMILCVASVYGMCNSTIFAIVMGSVALLMVVPGIYLYVVDGCRPEDYEEDGKSSAFVLWAMAVCVGSVYGICISPIFRLLMGAVAILLVLPGIYLYVVDGCRPDDYEENSEKESGSPSLWSLCLILGSIYGMNISIVFRTVMGTMAAFLLLPGVSLYMMDGCRPEDCEEQDTTESYSPYLWLTTLCLGSAYCTCVSTIFSIVMGTVAVLMVLPGIYLYVADGCRPEDFKYEDAKESGTLILQVLALCLGCVYAIGISSSFQIVMGAVAVLMILPGIYLYLVDGCRPEDYCVNDDDNGNGTPLFWLGAVCLGSAYGLCASGVFRTVMGTVAVLMVLPGIYLYLVDGCRPEDYEENDK